ncbi:hypothetical protein LTS18_010791 [Coniosporium uncinatum]|uniref:Uncharacterized protein n=1 Tax=Coniosporium uncinatum TaxID=93489 RepID=A0ACC3D9M6_9PEZI|nr:hypothetical protein LTS18_010791 [Coniosporium uncinatum]
MADQPKDPGKPPGSQKGKAKKRGASGSPETDQEASKSKPQKKKAKESKAGKESDKKKKKADEDSDDDDYGEGANDDDFGEEEEEEQEEKQGKKNKNKPKKDDKPKKEGKSKKDDKGTEKKVKKLTEAEKSDHDPPRPRGYFYERIPGTDTLTSGPFVIPTLEQEIQRRGDELKPDNLTYFKWNFSKTFKTQKKELDAAKLKGDGFVNAQLKVIAEDWIQKLRDIEFNYAAKYLLKFAPASKKSGLEILAKQHGYLRIGRGRGSAAGKEKGEDFAR